MTRGEHPTNAGSAVSGVDEPGADAGRDDAPRTPDDPAAVGGTGDGGVARGESGTQDGPARDRARRRVAIRILLVGALLSLAASLGAGALGLAGEVAGAVFLSLLSLTSGISGATLAIGLVVDQFRGHHVSVARVLLSGGLLLLTLVLLIASAGAFVAAVEAGP